MLTALLALSISLPTPGVLGVPRQMDLHSVCTRGTANGRYLVTRYTGAELYAPARARNQIATVDSTQIRLVTDDALCARMRDQLRRRAESLGGTIANSHPEFYRAGQYYVAVVPASPSKCRARPGTICIDTRWQTLTVFDQDLNPIAGVLI